MKPIPAHYPTCSMSDVEAGRRADLFLARHASDWGLFVKPTAFCDVLCMIYRVRSGWKVRGWNLMERRHDPRRCGSN